jgi:hypothetical protein
MFWSVMNVEGKNLGEWTDENHIDAEQSSGGC